MTQNNIPKSPARRRFFKLLMGTLALSGSAATYASEIEPEHLQVARKDISLPGMPLAAAGLRIGQLSDLHCQNWKAVARTRRAVQILIAEKPDVIVLTGDFISGSAASSWAIPCVKALKPLVDAHIPGGVFAIMGNHDWWSQQVGMLTDLLQEAGIQVLRNQSVPLAVAPDIWLVGLDDRWAEAQNPELALIGVPKTATKILLIHEPDYADEAPPGFALQLSGHSHGGQIRIPGLPPIHCPKLGRKYPEGLQQAQQHLVYTSRGIGMMGPQMRFCCPPEVNLLTLKHRDEIRR